MKQLGCDSVTRLLEIPNVGPASAADLEKLGILRPADLPGQDPFELYERLCRVTGQRHDPCVIDLFWAAIDFMEGEPARPWWIYSERRRRILRGQSRG